MPITIAASADTANNDERVKSRLQCPFLPSLSSLNLVNHLCVLEVNDTKSVALAFN